jgi:hypothetical protein
MDDLRPRFAFMSQGLSEAEIERFLGSLQAEVASYLKELKRFQQEAGPTSFTGRFAFEQGIESYRTLQRLAGRALAALRREGRKT